MANVMREWICAEDEVPVEECENVLCCVTGGYRNVQFIDAFMLGSYYGEDGWVLEMYPEWENPPVTHWMPLPEPPKK